MGVLKLGDNAGQANVDPRNHLQIIQHSDGTITRQFKTPEVPAMSDPSSPTDVLTKDIIVNPDKNTWVRVYLPREGLDSPAINKLPLVVYIHGGGFVLFSAASKIIHDYCFLMARELPCIVVSLEYRLAPEHRLPAAYEDAVEALNWVKTSDEEWLTKYCDYGNCFIMGSSAGGNIAYHTGLRGAMIAADLEPLKIKGVVLQHAFFGGVERTESEIRYVNDMVMPMTVTDFLWELSLPDGADRDHEYSNPTLGGGSKALDQVKSLEWTVMIVGSENDPVVDRERDLVKLMKEKGIPVVDHFSEGGYHGDFIESLRAQDFFVTMKKYI
ncbi:hypothetical protein K2173_026585 [Erythroxylum novogranatense]|uniref:Alpha/beta hydrolase fold-3 domain-containing protein n=1 Tax=Erythroxylum novogranatense TaxID=1862640 RepID=A0AAV8U0F5_9ROSI|nr:hypothetical protein K2173_026585 [Erythroxylum novogranatense]